jgi:hypothetical protein
MTIDNPTSQPSGDEFRETFDLVDRAIEQVTDQHIEDQLMKLLSAEYEIEADSLTSDWGVLDEVAGFEQHDGSEFEQIFPYRLELDRLAHQVRAAEANLAAAEAEAAAAQHRAIRERSRARHFFAQAAAAEKEADSLAEVALQRSQEIIDAAMRDASELVVTAERKAADLVAEAEKVAAQKAITSCGMVGAVDDRAGQSGHFYVRATTRMVGSEGMAEGAGLWTETDGGLPVALPPGLVYLGLSPAMVAFVRGWWENSYAPRHLNVLSCSSSATAHFRQAAMALERIALYCQEDEARELASATEPTPLAERVYNDLRAMNAVQDPVETAAPVYDESEHATQNQDEPSAGVHRATASASDCRG